MGITRAYVERIVVMVVAARAVCWAMMASALIHEAKGQGTEGGIRALPPTACMPRDPLEAAEWVWTREEEGGTLPELYPDEWQRWWQRTEDLGIGAGKPGESDLIQVAEALWDDYGTPDMNLANQIFISSVLARELRYGAGARASAETERLQALLREYVEAGGSRVRPEITANIGAALAAVSGRDDANLELAQDLLFEALLWEAEVSSVTGYDIDRSVLRAAIRQFGPGIRLEVYDLVECTVVAGAEPECYRKRCETLTRLLEALELPRSDKQRQRRVVQWAERACVEAPRSCGSEAAQEDLAVRFLIAMDLLGQTEGPRLPERLHRRICDTLARLGREDKLSTERAWRQWAEAVNTMARRGLSRPLGDFLRRGLDPANKACLLDGETRHMLRSLVETRRTKKPRRDSQTPCESPQSTP